MAKKETSDALGDLVTDKLELNLEDLCMSCAITQTEITTYVEEGIVKVEGEEPAQWRFSRVNLMEVRRAQRLTRDLGLNPAGVALALDLMIEIEDLKRRLAHLEKDGTLHI